MIAFEVTDEPSPDWAVGAELEIVLPKAIASHAVRR
jgi:hypothetical protein